MELIDLKTQDRIVKYFKRLDQMKPSEFDRNFVNEWRYLRILAELVLRPKVRQTRYQYYAHDLRRKKI